MDKAEQNQTDNTVKNGTAPNTSGNTSGNIPGNSPVGASARPETVASETTASEAAAENTTKAGYTQSAPAESSAAKTSAAASSPAEATAPGMEAVQVDAVQIDSARLDSTHTVYSTDLDPDDYEEVVEEYATTDAPDGTHREERRITRTTHHPHGKGDQKAGTQGNPDGDAEIIDVGEPETHTTTIRTVTRRGPAPRRPAHPPVPHAQQVPRREEPGGVGGTLLHAHVRGVRTVPARVRRAHHEHTHSGAVRRVPQHHSDDPVGPIRRRLLHSPVLGAAATLLHHA